MKKYISILKELNTNFSYKKFISLLEEIDSNVINGNIQYFDSECTYYFNRIISMVNDNYLVDGKVGTLGHMLFENALLEKKKITPTLAMCFFLEQKHELGFDEIFNNISFMEKENCEMFVDDTKQIFNINFKTKSFVKKENDVDKYNYDMMEIILHELTHIYQFTRTEKTENIFDKLVYYDYQQLKNLQTAMDYSLDKYLHDSFISEFMADENALTYMLKLAQQHPEYFNEELIQSKLEEYKRRKNGDFGNLYANPRKAEEKILRFSKELLEEIKNNYEQQVRGNGVEHVSWLISVNEKMLANAEEINKKRNPIIQQLQMLGISEKGKDNYYNIFLKSFYQYDGENLNFKSSLVDKNIYEQQAETMIQAMVNGQLDTNGQPIVQEEGMKCGKNNSNNN